MSLSPEIPQRIGKYEVKKLLGKGATGSVYLAADPFAQREVALKVMERLSSDADIARKQLRFFQNEAALAGKLRHPHIISIFDAGIDDISGAEPLRYLVMELVRGEPLLERCKPNTLLSPQQIIEVGYKCCKALEFANGLGVVHRDIKPANILMDGDFDIKVADFGAAQLARSEVTQVAGVGSPSYMSPEQVKGEEIDWRTDVYSLGAVLYHLLTSRRPFNGANTFELIENILNSHPPVPSSIRQDSPQGLDEIVRRAMGKTREERYASWEEFGDALAALASAGKSGGELLDAEKFGASRRLKFFKRFSDVELWEVLRTSKWKQHGAGEEMIREGSKDEHFYIVASGLLKVTQRGKLLNAVSPGECVGEMAYARRDSNVRSATVTAVEPSWAMRMRVDDVDKLSDGCRARFNEAFLSIMAERLSMLGGRLVSM
jgi:serine/threonine protein kinase